MAVNKDRFVPVDLYRELFALKLKPNHLLVLIVMSLYGRNGEEVYPSVARIAHETNYSEKNIPIILKELEKEGVLVRCGKTKFGTIKYKIKLSGLEYKPDFVSKRQKLRNESFLVKHDVFDPLENDIFD
jgi:Helix-turn-helix domain